MRILAVTPLYPPFSRVGAWLATHEFLAHLVDRGHEVAVAPQMNQPSGEHEGVTILGKNARPGTLAILASQFDLVVTHLAAGATAAETAGKPCVQMAHGTVNGRFDAFPGVSLVAANSEALAARIDGPSIVCHPFTRPESHLAEATGDAVTIVNHSDPKGGNQFARIAAALPARRFLAVAGGYGAQVPLRSPNIECWPTQPDMRKVWAETRVLLIPSEWETWGMVAVEAAMNGIPVIAHPSPGLQEALGGSGIFIDRDDTEAWVAAIESLDNPAVHAERSSEMKARAAQLPDDRDRFAEAIEALGQTGLKVAVIIPYRAVDDDRAAACDVVVRWWRTITRGQWQIVTVDAGGDVFSRGLSINDGASQVDADVIVAADADLLVGRDQMLEAVRLAVESPGLVQPFDRLLWFDERRTKELLAAPYLPWSKRPPSPTFDWQPNANTPLLGGINVFSRATFDASGGFLPFRGWGSEDIAFERQCSVLAGPTRRVPGIVAHLHHDKTGAYVAPNLVQANAALADRVAGAKTKAALRKVIANA